MSRHHKLKKVVFPEYEDDEDNKVLVCRFPCHDALEEIIRQKENAILRQHKEIYLETFKDFMNGKLDPDQVMREFPNKTSKRRRY